MRKRAVCFVAADKGVSVVWRRSGKNTPYLLSCGESSAKIFVSVNLFGGFIVFNEIPRLLRKAGKRFSMTGDGAGVLMDEARQDAYEHSREVRLEQRYVEISRRGAARQDTYERGRKGIIYERYSMVTGAART